MGQAEAASRIGEAEHAMGFGARVLGAARLDPHAWDEIAADAGALGQAALVAAAAAGAAAAVAGSQAGLAAAFTHGLGSLVSWLGLSLLSWAVANWFRHPLGLGTALRVVGFAMAPLVALALAAIPIDIVQGLVRLVAVALSLGAFVVGTRQALRVETARAGLVCLTAGLALIFVLLLVVTLESASS